MVIIFRYNSLTLWLKLHIQVYKYIVNIDITVLLYARK